MRAAHALPPRSEGITAVQPDGARLVREIPDARTAAALVVERKLSGLVAEVVDVHRGLPAIRLQPEAEVDQRIARQLRVEVDLVHRERAAVLDQPRRIRVPGAADLTPTRLLVLELRERGADVLHGK